MIPILLTCLVYAVAYGVLWKGVLSDNSKLHANENKAYIIIIAALAFAARAVFAVKYKGHETDMNCFLGWSDMIFNGGFKSFYSSDAFTDYPPGYMYVLYIVGAVRNMLGASDGLAWLIVKFPAIICDIITGVIIYRIAEKRLGNVFAALISAVYMFNPAVILNSSVWGQVDSVYTFFMVIMLFLLTERKTIAAYFVFALCIFIKPQAFMFMPLIVYAIIENVFMPKFSGEKFIKNLIGGLCAIAMIFVLALPFGIGEVTEQYKNTLASYPYMTVNAFNLWGALGQNWTEIKPVTGVINYIVLALIVAYSAYVFFKTKAENRYFIVGAVLSFSTFMLSAKMHDRYAFAAMAMLIIAFIYNPSAKLYLIAVISAVTQFFNAAWVLFIYEQDINKYFKSPVIVCASIINLIFFVYFIAVVRKQDAAAPIKRAVKEPVLTKEIGIARSKKYTKLQKTDYIVIVALMIVYGAIAFYKLGDTKAPQTFADLTQSPQTIDLGSDSELSKLRFYLGSYNLDDNRVLHISCRNESGNEVFRDDLTKGSVFCWTELSINETVRYVELSGSGDHLTMMEVGCIDVLNEVIKPVTQSELTDEQDCIPERPSYMNGTYFDEIYHARTGYEFVHGLDVYEWTHPPLGKDIIAIGIKLFGMTPFGWRCMGTLFGVLMIPVLYIFAHQLLKKRLFAVLTTILFTFDFMHFAQTRISTIDVYVTFFIMLTYYFMYKYYTLSFYDTLLKETLKPLALSGICMGLAIASKWTGIYAGTGLAVIFFVHLYKRYSEYLYAKSNPDGETNGISHKHITDSFGGNLRVTIIWCCIFFVAVPLVIYGLSYIPYLRAPSSDGIKTIIDNQKAIFNYHSKTVVESTHPYSSRWYEWIIMKRPIWYYSGIISDTVREGISSFGNPLVWWVGIPALGLMLYSLVTKKDKRAFFLVVAYVIQILFWIPVTRTTFIYHYFPCVPFLTLMIGCVMEDMYDEAGNKKLAAGICCAYAVAAVVLFAMFYPVLSGAPCGVEYAKNWLKWFDSWVLLDVS